MQKEFSIFLSFGNFDVYLQTNSPQMNVIFIDDALRGLYETGRTKDASGLKVFSYLHYEQLKYRPESSVRIINNGIERLLFTEHEDGIEIRLIEIDSKHYGNKR